MTIGETVCRINHFRGARSNVRLYTNTLLTALSTTAVEVVVVQELLLLQCMQHHLWLHLPPIPSCIQTLQLESSTPFAQNKSPILGTRDLVNNNEVCSCTLIQEKIMCCSITPIIKLHMLAWVVINQSIDPAETNWNLNF